jgi:hypothetical protein
MSKAKFTALTGALTLLLLAAACAPAATTTNQDERLNALEAKVNTLSTLQTELTTLKAEVSGLAGDPSAVAGLQSRLDGLQTRLDELGAEIEAMGAEEHASNPFEIGMAQYVMDTAGFHDMDETLNETKQVDPAYLSAVRRVHKILANTPWPEELHAEAEKFVELLAEFEAALEADDGERAAALATEVHEVQHDFSHAVDEWLGAGGDEH